MRRCADLLRRLRSLFRAGREDAETRQELHLHLEMETEKNVSGGMDPREARRQACLRLGGADGIREAVRDARGLRPLEDLLGRPWQRYAPRDAGVAAEPRVHTHGGDRAGARHRREHGALQRARCRVVARGPVSTGRAGGARFKAYPVLGAGCPLLAEFRGLAEWNGRVRRVGGDRASPRTAGGRRRAGTRDDNRSPRGSVRRVRRVGRRGPALQGISRRASQR